MRQPAKVDPYQLADERASDALGLVETMHALRALPRRIRIVVLLRLLGFRVDEIAERCSVSVATVERELAGARRHLPSSLPPARTEELRTMEPQPRRAEGGSARVGERSPEDQLLAAVKVVRGFHAPAPTLDVDGVEDGVE
jgi:Sigma-70, region 4